MRLYDYLIITYIMDTNRITDLAKLFVDKQWTVQALLMAVYYSFIYK